MVRLSGQWTALALARDRAKSGVTHRLRAIGREAIGNWDLLDVERLDYVGGQALWRIWGRRMPAEVELNDTQHEIFERVALLDAEREEPEVVDHINPVTKLGLLMFAFFDHLYGGLSMFGGFVMDLFGLVRHPKRIPWTEISANIYSAGAQALAITALVAFLIGIVLNYLSAQQLRMFGANQYIVNILGLSVIRELRPVLSAILVAGRSGSAITAQIGVM